MSIFACKYLTIPAAALLSLAIPARAATWDCSLSTVLCVSGAAGANQEYATIQAAVNVAGPGSTVVVFDGNYAGFDVWNAGTSAAPITVTAAGANAVIVSPTSSGDGINVENGAYVVIDGFQVQGATRAGIRSANTHDVIIRNNKINATGAKWGVFTGFTQRVQVINNEGWGAIQHGIYISNSNVVDDNPVIRGNRMHDNGNGIQLNGDCQTPDAYGVTDGVINGALIENNRFYNNTYKGMSLISMQGSTIRNNVVYGNGLSGGAAGIHFTDQIGCGKPSSNNTLVNNTIAEPRIASVRMTDAATGNVVFNNTAIGPSGIVDEVGGNYIDTASNLQQSSSTGLFLNASAGDYHLVAGSAAIDKGVQAYTSQTAPAADADGRARPQGPLPDIGAYEYAAAGDSQAPTVPAGLTATAATSSQINLAWTASTDNVAVAAYRIYRNGTQVGTATTTTYSDSGLTASTNYSYTVAAYDGAGNVSAQSAAASATTPAAADTTAPTVPGGVTATAASASQINLAWAASTDNVGVAGYRVYRNGAQVGTATATTYSDSGLTASTTYSYTVAAYDSAGNVSGQSAAASAKTSAAADTTAPVISGTAASGITTVQATISWTTNEVSNSYVDYGASTSYGKTLSSSAMVTSHSLTLTGLAAGTTYYYRVRSADAAGNMATGTNLSFVTTADPPPSAITDLAVSRWYNNSVQLVWTAPGADGKTGTAAAYDIRYSTSPLSESTWTTAVQASGEPTPSVAGTRQSYSLSGLRATTTYYIAIKARDAGGNVSAISNVVTAKK